MTEPTNHDRAVWARDAVEAFTANTGQTYALDSAEAAEVADYLTEVLGDLLANVLHLAAEVGGARAAGDLRYALPAIATRAIGHYETEAAEAADEVGR